MKRRTFITLIGGAAAAGSSPCWPRAARAQQTARSYRVAYLALLSDQDAAIVKQRLNELGYSEGKNLIFDFHSADGQLDRLPQLASELVKTNPDVIVTGFRNGDGQGGAGCNCNHPHRFHRCRRSDRSRNRQRLEPARC